MRVAVAIPEAHVKAPVLDAALEATTRLNESLIKEGDVPLFDEVRNKIRWKPEPPGDEHFDHAGVVLGRKWGDCDDMAPYAAASMRATGEDPDARAIVVKSGPKRWHAVVERGDGSIRDPSRETGMGSKSNGVMGAALPMMFAPQSAVIGGSYIARPQLALRPIADRNGQIEAWQARADLPWHWMPGTSPTDIAMAALHASPVSSQAIVGAVEGLIRLGEANDVDDDILDRAAAISDGCKGATWDELADEYGEDHATAAGQLLGGFFGGRPMRRVSGVDPGSVPVPYDRFPGDRAHLYDVFMRYMRGEQPREHGGKNFSMKEVQYGDANEKAVRAAMGPEWTANRLRQLGVMSKGAHKIRRDKKLAFGRALSSLAKPMLSLADMALPFIPGVGPLASQALHMAAPALQNLMHSGAHLPAGIPGLASQFVPQQFQQFMPQMAQQTPQQAFQMPFQQFVPQAAQQPGFGAFGDDGFMSFG